MAPWGLHYSLDASGCDYDKIRNSDHIRAFSKALIEAIAMVAHGDPRVEYFAEDDPTKAGITLDQLIVTSNICCHFVDAPREAYLDVFSCKDFDPATVERVFKDFFAGPEYLASSNLRIRQAPK